MVRVEGERAIWVSYELHAIQILNTYKKVLLYLKG